MLHFYYVGLWEEIVAFTEIAAGALRGLGENMKPTIIAIFGNVFLRIFWYFVVFLRWPDFTVLIIVYPISWIITGICMLGCYLIKVHGYEIKSKLQSFVAKKDSSVDL